MSTSLRTRRFQDGGAKIGRIVDQAEDLHQEFDKLSFGSSSLHFHLRALERRPIEERVEPLYAMLATWGMDRPGHGGPKLKAFDKFAESVLGIGEKLTESEGVTYDNATEAHVGELADLARSFTVMDTGPWLVANSKILHHLLPDLVGPIDRRYTLVYLTGGDVSDLTQFDQQALFRDITVEFYWQVARDQRFRAIASLWISQPPSSWDTSFLKVVDNLVVAAVRDQAARKSDP